jgi:hypothetical protein
MLQPLFGVGELTLPRTPYLVRRACGSYQLQIRLRPALASAFGKSHFKIAATVAFWINQ